MGNSTTVKIWKFLCKHKYLLAIIGIILLAAILRYSGYNWDNLYSIHPDERALDQAGNRINFLAFKLDPEFYAYGSLPIYLATIIKSILFTLFPSVEIFGRYVIIGRLISATAGTLTVLAVYLIGKKLYSVKAGLLSSFLLAITVIHIQNSHFATVDVLLTFFITITLYFLIDIFNGKATNNTYYIVSILIGLALAVKASAAPIVVIFFICHIINLIRNKKLFVLKGSKELKNYIEKTSGNFILNNIAKLLYFSSFAYNLLKPFLFFALCGLIALGINFIVQPYAYLKFQEFYKSIKYQIEIQKFARSCYLQQYVGTPFLLYYLKELILRCMGPPLGILCIISFVIATIITIRHPVKSKHTVLLLWALPYFATINTFESKFLRYLLPLIPFFCLFAGYYFTVLLEYLKTSRAKRIAGYMLTIILIGYTLFYSLAFFSIYMKPHTFVVGSKWFHVNIPENAVILSQHWDEGFPLNTRTSKRREYDIQRLELYELFRSPKEDATKADYLAKNLVNGDYIVAQTRRLYGATYNVKDKYPITSRYFDLLFTNRLGFKLVKEFNSYPSLLGIEIEDDTSDESFSVYDHPKILIFKKVQDFSKQEYLKLLMEDEELTLTKNQALSIHKEGENQVAKYSIVDEIAMTLIWLLIIEAISIIGFVIGYIIFKGNRDSSIFYSYIIGLLTLSYTVWLLTYLKIIMFLSYFIIVIFITSLLLSIKYLYDHWKEIKEWFKENIDTVAFCKLAFIACFILFLIFRSLSPEVYWGEKPMDFGIFNNLISINYLPPDEIWFSGKSLSYYYFGHFIYAMLTKLSFLPNYYTYNLSLATLAALTFVSAAGIIYMLCKSYYYSCLSGILTVFIGNLAGIRELIYGKNPLNFHFYWATSRVIPHTVNEYPIWSFVFGDLHGHVLVMPVFIFLLYLGILLCKNIFQKGPILWPVVILTSFILGSISITNSWDLPGGCALLFACITTGLYLAFKGQTGKSNIINCVKNYSLLAGIVAINFVWFLPYWLAARNTSVARIGILGNSEFVRIEDYILIWGLFLFIFISFFLFEIFKSTREAFSKQFSSIKSSILSASICLTLIFIMFINIFYSSILFAFVSGIFESVSNSFSPINQFLIRTLIHLGSYCSEYATKPFTLLIIILGIITFFLLKNNIRRLICALTVYGLLITLFSQLFFIYDRSNTLFKYNLEAWFIFSISAIYILYCIFRADYFAFRSSKSIYTESLKLLWFIPAGLILFLSIFTSVSVIVGFSMTDKVQGFKPQYTINGLSYKKHTVPSEFKALQWINKNIKGGHKVMLEAYGNRYGDYSRIVMNTGIPTLVGWDYHLTQRGVGRKEINERIKDVETIYTTQNSSLAYNLLKKYKVNYVYIGPLEIKEYGLKGLSKFNANPTMFKLIYSDKESNIYEIL